MKPEPVIQIYHIVKKIIKEQLNYDTFSTNEKVLLDSAIKGLKEGRHGPINADELINS